MLQTTFVPLRMPTFVMFSAYKHRAFQEFSIMHGVDYIIDKPPNQDEIFTLVMKVLEDAYRPQTRQEQIRPEDLI
jgi:hypothetical protein